MTAYITLDIQAEIEVEYEVHTHESQSVTGNLNEARLTHVEDLTYFDGIEIVSYKIMDTTTGKPAKIEDYVTDEMIENEVRFRFDRGEIN